MIKYKIKKCIICKKKFKIALFPGKFHNALKTGVRGKNCLTCSKECSRKYYNNFKNFKARQILKCPRCNNIVEKNKRGRPKKFCSVRCRACYNSLKRYHKLKNNKEFKDKQRKNFKQWRIKNREHFNKLCLDKSKIYQFNITHQRKKKGLCPICGSKRDSKFKQCLKCRIKRRRKR